MQWYSIQSFRFRFQSYLIFDTVCVGCSTGFGADAQRRSLSALTAPTQHGTTMSLTGELGGGRGAGSEAGCRCSAAATSAAGGGRPSSI